MMKRYKRAISSWAPSLAAAAFVLGACDDDVDLGGDPKDDGDAGATAAGTPGTGGATSGSAGSEASVGGSSGTAGDGTSAGSGAGATNGEGGVAGAVDGGAAGQGTAGGGIAGAASGGLCEPDSMGQVTFTVAEVCSFHDCPATFDAAFEELSPVCSEGLIDVTSCNGARSVVLNGGFTFNAYAYDIDTGELVGVALASDTVFGPCERSTYLGGIGWNQCGEAETCNCTACPSCGAAGGEGGAAGAPPSVAGAAGAGGAGGAEPDSTPAPCVP